MHPIMDNRRNLGTGIVNGTFDYRFSISPEINLAAPGAFMNTIGRSIVLLPTDILAAISLI